MRALYGFRRLVTRDNSMEMEMRIFETAVVKLSISSSGVCWIDMNYRGGIMSTVSGWKCILCAVTGSRLIDANGTKWL